MKWTVRRDSRYLVPSVLRLITAEAAGTALRRPLKITFDGEAGVDEGGILSEVRFVDHRVFLLLVFACVCFAVTKVFVFVFVFGIFVFFPSEP